MSEELKKLSKNHQMSKINGQLPKARRIVEEAYRFFQENSARTQFTKIVEGKPDYLLLALQQVASEPMYKFKVRYVDYFSIGYKFYIYRDKIYSDFIDEDAFNC